MTNQLGRRKVVRAYAQIDFWEVASPLDVECYAMGRIPIKTSQVSSNLKMPADIRSFFGNNTSTPIRAKEVKKEEDSKKKRTSEFDIAQYGLQIANGVTENRKVIDDSDDEEPT